jgi:hypothetical protein
MKNSTAAPRLTLGARPLRAPLMQDEIAAWRGR